MLLDEFRETLRLNRIEPDLWELRLDVFEMVECCEVVWVSVGVEIDDRQAGLQIQFGFVS
jgi:hypothetical protein